MGQERGREGAGRAQRFDNQRWQSLQALLWASWGAETSPTPRGAQTHPALYKLAPPLHAHCSDQLRWLLCILDPPLPCRLPSARWQPSRSAVPQVHSLHRVPGPRAWCAAQHGSSLRAATCRRLSGEGRRRRLSRRLRSLVSAAWRHGAAPRAAASAAGLGRRAGLSDYHIAAQAGTSSATAAHYHPCSTQLRLHRIIRMHRRHHLCCPCAPPCVQPPPPPRRRPPLHPPLPPRPRQLPPPRLLLARTQCSMLMAV